MLKLIRSVPAGRCYTFRVMRWVMIYAMVVAFVAAGQTSAWGRQAAEQDVEIELVQFGVGSSYRPGDLAAIRVRLTNSSTDARQTWVQWEVPNADGDLAEYGRIVTLPRGGSTSTWLYAPIKPNGESIWTIRVMEMVDGQRRGELGGAKIAADSASGGAAVEIPPNAGAIAVLGSTTLSLDRYYNVDQRIQRPYAAHEMTRVARPSSIGEFPDRWYGWKPFEAIVWGGYRQLEPADLSPDQADAIREYIVRGGHLVIVLPLRGDHWGIGIRDNVRTELSDLLPRDPLKTREIPIDELLPAMSKSNRLSASPGSIEIKHFGDAGEMIDRPDNHFQPLIVLPDGTTLVAQRTYGHGHVTVVGVDITSGQLASVPYPNGSAGMPQADIFWNRILGRRADAPSPAEIVEIEKAQLLNTEGVTMQPNQLGRGALMADQIAMDNEGAMGLLLALVLFAIYWLSAGPVGHMILKQYKAVRHAWVIFALCAGVFTAVAWGAVSLLPSVAYEIQHVTYLDHVARSRGDQSERTDPQNQRAVSWFSVYLDSYGTTALGIDDDLSERNLLMSWDVPGVEPSRFPNVDRYAVDVGRAPASIEMPSRSTATQMQANWYGPLSQDWGGMIRESENDEVRLEPDESIRPFGKRLRGTLRHDFPATLTDVSVIWVTDVRPPNRMYAESGTEGMRPWVPTTTSGSMLNRAVFVRRGEWQPQEALQLDSIFMNLQGLVDPRSYFDATVKKRYTEEYQLEMGSLARTMSENDRRNYMEMLSFFHMLEPPNYLLSSPGANEDQVVAFTREMGREVDLSAWFNRPCLIVMGYLESVEIPIPVRLGGQSRAPSSDGTVMVRWIMPLPIDPERSFRQSTESVAGRAGS